VSVGPPHTDETLCLMNLMSPQSVSLLRDLRDRLSFPKFSHFLPRLFMPWPAWCCPVLGVQMWLMLDRYFLAQCEEACVPAGEV
jgi:hypothetical protein